MSKDYWCSKVFLVITFFVHLAIAQPIGDGSSSEVQTETGVGIRKSIDSMNLNKGSSIDKHDNPCSKDVTSNDHVHNRILGSLRSRRSPKYPPQPQPQLSNELQTIMSGNWHEMNPESLFKLLNTLATSKETLPDDFYGYDDPDDEDPIDLVYSGRNKPLLLGATFSSSSSSNRGSNVPKEAKPTTIRGAPPLGEPISIMSSNMHHLRNEDEATPFQKHGVSNKKPFPTTRVIFKRPMNQDLVQLPTGEIAFTPRGIHVLRYHHPTPSGDEGITLVRRPIL